MKLTKMKFNYTYNDGGRSDAGLKGDTDCGIRAMAIACDITYTEARTRLKEAASVGKQGNKAISRGIYKEDLSSALELLGWHWKSAPNIFGRKARCSDFTDEGTIIARQARHFVAVVDGVPNDTWDSSEKMVYGYWKKVN